MDISVSDLGPVGAMKTITNTVIVMAAVGIVLTWPEEFRSAGALAVLTAGVFFTCGVLEWAFRGWHKEQADKIEASNQAMHASNQALLQSGVPHLPYARCRLIVAETALAKTNQVIVNNTGQLRVEHLSPEQMVEVNRQLEAPDYDPSRNPFIIDPNNPIVRARK